MSWLNNDGLYVRFDAEKTVPAAGGEYPGAGALRVIEARIEIPRLTTTPAIIHGGDSEIYPRNSRIEEVEVVTESAVGTITSLSFGLKRLDRSTEIDHDGLVAALVVASMDAAGEKTVLRPGSTSAGALIGTTLTYPGLPVAYIAGSTGTGVVRVRVKLFVPGKDANPSNY